MKSKLILIAILGVIQSFGQTVFEGNSDKTRSVARSEKLNAMPEINDSVIEIPPVKYYIEPASHEVTFETEPISPARLKVVEPLEKLYSGYVKAGVGNYTMPYFEAYYNSTRSKKSAWGIDAKHHSAWGNIKDVGVSQFNDNHIGGFYKKFYKKFNWTTRLSYDRNAFHYYGFNANDTLIPETYRTNKDTIAQAYDLIAFETVLQSMFKDSNKIHHTVSLNYHFLSGTKGLNEHNTKVKANLFKYINREEIGADVLLDVNAIKQPYLLGIGDSIAPTVLPPTYANTVFQLNPYIFSRGKDWSVKAGLNIHADIDDVSRFRFYPNVEAKYSLFNDIFIPYVGITGGTSRNSFNSLRKANPFILQNAELKNTNKKIHLYGGIRGSISSKISFNASIGHEVLENLPLYLFDSIYSYNNQFNVIYESLSRTTIKGQISYQELEKLKLFGKMEYFAYSLGNEDYPWNLPDWQLTISGVYDLADKIIARANIFVVGSRKTYSNQPLEGVAPENDKYILTLKPFVDANLGFEYRYNKKLSAFIDFNNFIGKKYQRWSNYPVQSFNVLGGISYSF